MGRITGMEALDGIPDKVVAMYDAVGALIMKGLDVPDIKVSMITAEAGIGKGTAYEYFESKEEIIICALVYHMRRMSEKFEAALEQCGSFKEQLSLMLNQCGRDEADGHYFIRFVHVITDNTVFGQLVRNKMSDPNGEAPIVNVLGRILKTGMERGEVRGDLPLDYMVCTLFSRLLTYIIYLYEPGNLQMEAPRMRELIYQGVVGEFVPAS